MQEASLFDAIMLYLDFGHEPREKALNRAAMKLTRLHMFSTDLSHADVELS